MNRLCLLVLPLIATLSGAALAAESPSNADGFAAVRTLCAQNLRLSTGQDSASNQFAFTFRMNDGNRTGADRFEIVVEREKDRPAALVRSADGLPFFYITDGFAVRLDQSAPGTLFLQNGAEFRFIVEGNAAKGGNDYEFRCQDKTSGNQIVLDLGSTFAVMLSKAKSADVDAASGVITVSSERVREVIRPTAAPAPAFPIDSDVTNVAPGRFVAFAHIRTSVPPERSILVSKERILAAGLDVKALKQAPAEQSPIPPVGFWSDERNKAAAKKLAALFPRRAETDIDVVEPSLETGEAHHLMDAAAREHLRKALVARLVYFHEVLSKMNLTSSQRDSIGKLFAERSDQIDRIIEKTKSGEWDNLRAIAEGRKSVDVGPKLRDILGDGGLTDFVQRWQEGLPHPPPADGYVEDYIPKWTNAFATLDTSNEQKKRFADLIVSVGTDYELEEFRFLTEGVDEATSRANQAAFSKRLAEGTRDILGAQKYHQFLILIGATTQPVTARP